MDMSKYQELFFSESREHLQTLNSLLLEMEKNGFDEEKMGHLFRAAHSIKGMASTMGFSRTAKLAHQLEEWLSSLRNKKELAPQMAEWLFEGFGVLESLIDDLENKREEREIDFFLKKFAGQKTVQSTATLRKNALQQERPAKPGRPLQTITLHIDLDKGIQSSAKTVESISIKLTSAGELTDTRFIGKANGCCLEIQIKTTLSPDVLRKILGNIPGVEKVAFPFALSGQEPQAKAPAPLPKSVRMSTDVLDYLNNITGELITTRHRLEASCAGKKDEAMEECLTGLSRQIGELQHHVRKIRMMPLEHITASLPRFVRDLSRETGKDIQLETAGENIELDRSVLEALADPMLHLIRNAVDHGIEKEGKVSISAVREQDLVVLRIKDNGKGIDVEEIRDKAVRLGLATNSQLEKFKHQDILQLICHPGFSTAQKITKVSGRGVGMDIVKSAVNQLGGSLVIQSAAGQGTEMILKIPLHVAIINILLVEAGGQKVGIPITQVYNTMEVRYAELWGNGENPTVDLTPPSRAEEDEEKAITPVVFLGELLTFQKPQAQKSVSLVITECGGRKIGIGVDKLIGKKEVFAKNLEAPLREIKGLGSATILGDGRIFFILDIQSLLQRHPLPGVVSF
ncbi:MAG: chemotaxis protein CheA [Deltaproteobacteria bacterium]|nr:chemotaxis protein CheA [Deltaproteobacteria bacterium]